jgi:hypothetical protein
MDKFPTISRVKIDLENEFQFQFKGYARVGGGVNPLCHKRA